MKQDWLTADCLLIEDLDQVICLAAKEVLSEEKEGETKNRNNKT